MLVTPQQPRFSVEEGPGLRLTLPCKKRWFTILFFCVWMVGWYFGESSEIPKVIKQLHSGELPIFDLIWLAGWTFFGVFFSLWIIWRLLGSEVIGVENGWLSLRKQIAGLGMTREFEISNIAALRFRPERGSGKRHRESCIELDYGAKTYNFGADIDPAEATQLLDVLAKWLPTVGIERAVESERPPSVQSLGLR
jgi:hypothetical protein